MSSTTTGAPATDEGNAVLTCTSQQKGEWITDKVGGGGYLEEIVRGYFAIVQASQTPQQEDCPYSEEEIRDAAAQLQLLERTKIWYPARHLAGILPIPVAMDMCEVDAFKREQYRRWLDLNINLDVYQKGVEKVEMAQDELLELWEAIKESATFAIEGDGRSSETCFDEYATPELKTERPPSTLERREAFDTTGDSTEAQSQYATLCEQYENHVRACKEDIFDRARDDIQVSVSQIARTLEHGHGEAVDSGNAARAYAWREMWESHTHMLLERPSSLRICPSGKCFLSHITGYDGTSQD
jgi:hypothetical protein